jgi:hypothetical protein
MADTIRNVVISGGAMADFEKRRGTTRKARAPQTGGFDTAPGPAIAMGAMNISKIGSFRKNIGGAFQSGGASSGASSLVSSPSPAPVRVPLPSAGSAGSSVPPPTTVPPASAAPGQIGGAKKKSLVLAPPKKQTRKSKVHLAPPASKDKKPAHNLKTTRKIRVHLGGLKKRLCRAKTIKHDSRKKPISEIRRTLEEAKLVKPCANGKEVPEDVLRTIFHDYMLLRNRVL